MLGASSQALITMSDDLQDDDLQTEPDADAAEGGAPGVDTTAGPQPSPASFWDRSTWDPDSLGAVAFGEPTAPYRPPSQVQADAIDTLLIGPDHPGWAEPITRMAIDRLTPFMPTNSSSDGLLANGMKQLAADGHPDFQAWAADRGLPTGSITTSVAGMSTPSQTGADVDNAASDASVSDGTPDSESSFEVARNDTTQSTPTNGPPTSGRSYDAKPDAVIPADLQSSVDAIGRSYFAQTGKRMMVTSGYRDALDQASAMYAKFQTEKGNDYVNKSALKPIRAAFDNGQAARLPAAQTIENMRQQIQNQIDNGVHISDHTVGNGQAIDIRTNGLSPKDRDALRTAIEDNAGIIHPEAGHPHFHVKLLGLRGRQ